MARAPKLPCRYPGCGQLVERSGYCEEHKKLVNQQYEATRETAVKRGYNTRWRNVRKIMLNRFPICQICESRGETTPATLVHHVDRNPKNNDFDNLLCLCVKCHEAIHKHERWGK